MARSVTLPFGSVRTTSGSPSQPFALPTASSTPAATSPASNGWRRRRTTSSRRSRTSCAHRCRPCTAPPRRFCAKTSIFPEQRSSFEMIATQASRLSQITEEVLLTSRLDRGDLPVDAEPVDVAGIVSSTVDAMRPRLSDATEIEVEIPGDIGAASGDRDRLQQVLVELARQRRQVRRQPDQSPCLPHERRDPNLRRGCGPGIALVDRPRIFEKFYRADPHLTRSPGVPASVSTSARARSGAWAAGSTQFRSSAAARPSSSSCRRLDFSRSVAIPP